MTVREKKGRRRYVHFDESSTETMRRLVNLLDNSRVITYRDITALRIRHDQLPSLRQFAEANGISIDMVSGTLKTLRRKILEI